MPKVSADHLQARRRQILDGARSSFARHGYEGATVRLLEEQIGMSRGAIFHHFPDKDALFLALAEEDADEVAAVVNEAGLVEAMRRLRGKDAGWLGVQLEVARRVSTDPAFRELWAPPLGGISRATQARLARQRDAGVVRADVSVETLAAFLSLVYDGLVAHLATGMPAAPLDGVLDLVEQAVRETPATPSEPPTTHESPGFAGTSAGSN